MRHLAFTPDHLEIAVLDPFAPMTFAIPAARNRQSKNEVEPESGNLVTRLIRLLGRGSLWSAVSPARNRSWAPHVATS